MSQILIQAIIMTWARPAAQELTRTSTSSSESEVDHEILTQRTLDRFPKLARSSSLILPFTRLLRRSYE